MFDIWVYDMCLYPLLFVILTHHFFERPTVTKLKLGSCNFSQIILNRLRIRD